MLRRLAALAFALSLLGAACSTDDSGGGDGATGGDTGTTGSGEPIVVGFPADLSTDWSYYDVPMEEGAQFAIDQINASGGISGASSS